MSRFLAALRTRRPFHLHLLALLTTLGCVCFAHAGPLWFSDDRGIHAVETDTNAVTRNISRDDVEALALNAKDGSLWALTSGRLYKYNANGGTLLSLDLDDRSRNFHRGQRLALDPSDGSIWAAGENNALHLDSTGHVLARIETRDDIQDIALAQNGTLWVLSDGSLSRYSAQGAFLGKDNLEDDMRRAEFLAIDNANGLLWLAGAKKVFQIGLALPIHTKLTRSTSEEISALALDNATGKLWVAGEEWLWGYTKEGVRFAAVDLDHRNVDRIRALAFDAGSQSVWVGNDNGLSRVKPSTLSATSISAARRKVTAIAAAATSATVPVVTLVSPLAGALTGNALIPIRLHYSAVCGGQPCNFLPSVFAAYVLDATLNGQPIGSLFVFDSATSDAVYTPTVRYPEGVNTFSAFVTDSAAQRSATITSQFSVDSAAPHFVSVTPADGSAFTSPNITLQGSIDDAAGRVTLESFTGATFTGANPQGPSFSYAVTLASGSNSLRLTASDSLGNATPLSLTYSLSSLTLTITSPANGATIDDNKVTVTGTFTGDVPVHITVAGRTAVNTGNTFTAADVPLFVGPNTITAVGTSLLGAVDTKSITVNSTAPSITITSPPRGSTVNGNSVLVRGTIVAPPRSGVAINGVVAAVDTAGNFSAVVPLAPGANMLIAKVTTPRGSSVAFNVDVVASGLPPTILATAAPLSGMAPLAVTFTVTNPTAAAATFFLNTSGPFTVPAGAAVNLSITYPEGVSTASVVVSGGAAQSFVINVTSINSMDAMLQALWGEIAGNLAAGNIEGALVFFAPGMREKYRRVFNDIAPELPALIATFPPIKATAMQDGYAEYFMAIPQDGKTYGYYLYFMRDGDGIWRLHSL